LSNGHHCGCIQGCTEDYHGAESRDSQYASEPNELTPEQKGVFVAPAQLLEAPGAFEMAHRFDETLETLGLWTSYDGDGTGSSFDLEIQRITLHTEALPAD
jgi:hypothetical protein